MIVARPLPDTDTLGAVLIGFVHGQPLGRRMFSGYHHVDVVTTAQAVVHDRQ